LEGTRFTTHGLSGFTVARVSAQFEDNARSFFTNVDTSRVVLRDVLEGLAATITMVNPGFFELDVVKELFTGEIFVTPYPPTTTGFRERNTTVLEPKRERSPGS
jgi:hypothetical protein